MADIKLLFTNIAGAHHSFLLYTDDNGKQEYISGHPRRLLEPGADNDDLVVTIGPYAPGMPNFPVRELNGQAFYDPQYARNYRNSLEELKRYSLDQAKFDANYLKHPILAGSETDIKQSWEKIKARAEYYRAQHLDYSALEMPFSGAETTNCNSLSFQVLRDVGLAPDQFQVPLATVLGLPGSVLPWAPGSHSDLNGPGHTITAVGDYFSDQREKFKAAIKEQYPNVDADKVIAQLAAAGITPQIASLEPPHPPASSAQSCTLSNPHGLPDSVIATRDVNSGQTRG